MTPAYSGRAAKGLKAGAGATEATLVSRASLANLCTLGSPVVLQPEARPRRLIPRFPLTQQVQVRSAGAAPRRYPARDVSSGGFFLATTDALDLFSDVELDVLMPSGEQVTLGARVVHILTPEKAQSAGVPAGIGVQFEGLNEAQLAHVQTLVAWARANDPRPRIARHKPGADTSGLSSQPMLAYLFEHIDGKRDPEALAEELGIEAGSIERMLRELCKLDVIELIAANGGKAVQEMPQAQAALPRMSADRASVHRAAPVKPVATPLPAAPGVAAFGPQHASLLQDLEQRLQRSNLYVLIDLPENASIDAIRGRCGALIAALNVSNAPAAEAARIERMQGRLREAFGVLSSPQKRAEYSEYLERGRTLAAAKPAAGAPGTTTQGQPQRAPGERASVTQAQAVKKAPAQPAARNPAEAPLGAAAQILAQAEAAHAAGKLADANRHLQLLTAMTFDDAKIRARVAQLKAQVARTLAVDFEKQAAYEEKQQKWALAARSWQRVADGRPKDSLPLQRAALAILQANGDLKQAVELGKRAVDLAENDAQAHRTLARIFVAAGMEANARRELEAAQRCAAPDSPEAAKAKAEGGLFKRLLGREAN